MADSFLNSFWAEPDASFSTTAGAIVASLGCDDDSSLLSMLCVARDSVVYVGGLINDGGFWL